MKIVIISRYNIKLLILRCVLIMYPEKVNRESDILKLIAVTTMLTDHLGAVFFAHYPIFRIVGRIAFPIFAYYIAMGFIRTKNFNKYFIRMFIFAVIAQIPFSLFAYILIGNYLYFNVLFTFLLALSALYLLKKKKYIIMLAVIILPTILETLTIVETDYGTYGILMVFVFYIFRNDMLIRNISVLVLTVAYSLTLGVPILHFMQLYCIVALPIIDYIRVPRVRMPKYFFYWFYPVHIAIIVIIHYLIL